MHPPARANKIPHVHKKSHPVEIADLDCIAALHWEEGVVVAAVDRTTWSRRYFVVLLLLLLSRWWQISVLLGRTDGR